MDVVGAAAPMPAVRQLGGTAPYHNHWASGDERCEAVPGFRPRTRRGMIGG